MTTRLVVIDRPEHLMIDMKRHLPVPFGPRTEFFIPFVDRCTSPVVLPVLLSGKKVVSAANGIFSSLTGLETWHFITFDTNDGIGTG